MLNEMINRTLLASFTLARRELIRFLRQRSRIIGSLVTPLVFWVFIGFGMGHSFSGESGKPQPGGYANYFFTGVVLMSVLFTAIFSTISVIEDRREGFLQGVLVAPVGRVAIVLGKVLGGAILATGQALLLVILGCLVNVASLNVATLIETILVLFIISIGLTALGLCIAWRLSSTQGFHAIMNIFLMPMWIMSGALFPLRDDSPRIMKIIMLANPLSYALALMRRMMSASEAILVQPNYSTATNLTVTLFAAAAMVGLAIVIAQGRSTADAV